MIKVFLDSSVIVAAAGSQTGGSFEIINLIEKGKLDGWINEGVVAESEEAIRRKLNQEKYQLFLNWLEEDYFKILPFPEEEKLEKLKDIDQKDRHILISAQESKSDFLVSLDRKHILTEESQRIIPKIQIATPKKFLQKHHK